jgi:hypothetical protein
MSPSHLQEYLLDVRKPESFVSRTLKRLERMKLPARDLVLLELAPCLEKCPHVPGESQSDLEGQFNRIGRHPVQILLVCSKAYRG